MKKTKVNIAIFASGNGSNAQTIIEYFATNKQVEITCVYSNNTAAYALVRSKNLGIKTFTFTKNDFYTSNKVANHLNTSKTNLIVLAGFMWLVPAILVENFTIINIHPALLPNFGGKGMYGHFVHKAVIKSGKKESGITIHYVDKEYDNGSIILQEKCFVLENDTPETLAERIHLLEHKHYPETIYTIVKKLRS